MLGLLAVQLLSAHSYSNKAGQKTGVALLLAAHASFLALTVTVVPIYYILPIIFQSSRISADGHFARDRISYPRGLWKSQADTDRSTRSELS